VIGRVSGAKRFTTFLCHAALLALVLHPICLILFRLMIFNTLPRDDYAPYLLWLLGESGGAFPASPYGYRILSVLAAAPFYYLLPPFALTNLPGDLGAQYVRATAALSISSYLALVASGVLGYRLAVDRFGLGKPEGIFAGLFVLTVQLYAAPFGVDPLAILISVMALYFIDRIYLFAAILMVSIAFNEKIAILFAIWLTIRCILDSGDRVLLGRQWIAAMAAILAYAAMIALVRLPGHSEQLDPVVYVPTLLRNFVASTTPRGIMLNIVPCLLLVGAVVWSWRSIDWRRGRLYAPRDLLIVPALACVALVLTQFYQVGRVVAHGAPLFIFPLAQAFGFWVRGGTHSETVS
jgi:hypothetical protein